MSTAELNDRTIVSRFVSMTVVCSLAKASVE